MNECEGVINFFEELSGFGFIRRKKGRDVFFKFNNIIDMGSLEPEDLEGKKVSFLLKKTKKGPNAENIKII